MPLVKAPLADEVHVEKMLKFGASVEVNGSLLLLLVLVSKPLAKISRVLWHVVPVFRCSAATLEYKAFLINVPHKVKPQGTLVLPKNWLGCAGFVLFH